MTRALNALTFALLVASLVFKNPLLFLLGVLLALVAGVTALWDRYALFNVTYTRRIGAPRMFVGEETDLWIEIVNAKLLPLAWLRVEDEIPNGVRILRGKVYHSHKPARCILATLTSLRFYERVRRHYRLRAMQRGAFEFGPAGLRSGDIFGFRYQEKVVSDVDWLIVYPKVVPVTALGLPAAYILLATRRPGLVSAQTHCALWECAIMRQAIVRVLFTGRLQHVATSCRPGYLNQARLMQRPSS